MSASKPVKPAVAAARQAAFTILLTVERGQAHSDDLLRGRSVSRLSPPDRHLATALVLGVLRWQIQLDARVRGFLKRPGARLDPEVQIALRLGAFQILHLDRIPAHAAIDESVELARQAGHRFASGMVNAVLRKLAAAPTKNVAYPDGAESAAVGCDEVTAAHPRWMVERWASLFGPDRTRAVCRHNQQTPVLTVRLAGGEVERELTDAGIMLASGAILNAARVITAGDVTATEAFREGRIRIQDEGSQLVAELAAAAVPAEGYVRSILDGCAAPGGKTLILAERHPDAHITARDASAPRLEQLQERMKGLAPRVECRLADAAALEDESAFNLVLVDVPCSGTGTLSRNPEIRHRLSPEDLARQAERQRAILRSALRAVRPGGRVVYSTCSLEPEEDEEVVAAILNEIPAARIVSPQSVIDTMLARGVLLAAVADRLCASITPGDYLRLFPDAFGTDGFFIAILERTS